MKNCTQLHRNSCVTPIPGWILGILLFFEAGAAPQSLVVQACPVGVSMCGPDQLLWKLRSDVFKVTCANPLGRLWLWRIRTGVAGESSPEAKASSLPSPTPAPPLPQPHLRLHQRLAPIPPGELSSIRGAPDIRGKMEVDKESKSITRDKKLSSPLIFSMVGSGLGLLHYRYMIFLMHNAVVLKMQVINLVGEESEATPALLTFVMFIMLILFPIGILCGIFLCGSLADRYGRKTTMLINNGFEIISSVILCLNRIIQCFEFTMFARFFAGIGAGSFSCSVPLYILEISPLELRGALVTSLFLFMTWGHLLGQILSDPHVWGNPEGYPLLMGIIGIIAIISNVVLLFCPESPRFLYIQRDDKTTTRQVLKKLRGKEDVEDEMEEMRQEQLAESSQRDMTVWRLLCFRSLRWHVITVVILVSGSQFMGISTAFVFSEKLYTSLGLSTKAVRLIPLAGNLLVQLMLLTAICTVETLGRRFLILTGFLICSITNISLAFSVNFKINNPSLAFISIVLIILFYMGYIVGPASIHIVIVGELFLQSSRLSAFVIAGIASWLTSSVSVVVSLLTVPYMGPYCLLLYWPFIILTFIYILRMVPETSDMTFQRIQRCMAVRIPKISRKTMAE